MTFGLSTSLRHALQAASTTPAQVSTTRLESQFERRYCQIGSTGFNSGDHDGGKISVTVFETVRWPVVCQPARSGSGTACDPRATWREISSRCVCVASVLISGGADPARRAARAEETGVLIALVGGLAGPCPAPRPLPDDPVLPPNPRLVLEPDFDLSALRQVSEVGVQGPGEVLLNASKIDTSSTRVQQKAAKPTWNG